MLLRLVAIILTNVLVCMHAAAGFAETARTKSALIGPVHTVTTKAYGHAETEIYDRAGNLVEAIIDLAHGNSSIHYLFHHDQQGYPLEEVAIDPDGKLIYRKRFAYAWDSQGRETASVAVSDDGEFHYAEFSLYDQFGNASEQLLVHGTTAHRSLFDVLGHVIYSAQYSSGELINELRHRYDERGRLIEIISYNAEGAMTGKVINEYDEAGLCIRATTEQVHAGGKRTWMTIYEYDGMGNWIKELTSEAAPISEEAETAQAYAVQERSIEYYDTHEAKTP